MLKYMPSAHNFHRTKLSSPSIFEGLDNFARQPSPQCHNERTDTHARHASCIKPGPFYTLKVLQDAL